MKLNELLEGDIEDRAQMGDALSDVAAQHLVQIEEDPVLYYRRYGEQLEVETASEIARGLASLDDRTFDLIANSPVIVRSLEDGGIDYDEPFIEVNALMDVLSRAMNRMAKNQPAAANIPGEERIGYDASRPGYDDPAAYDEPPTR